MSSLEWLANNCHPVIAYPIQLFICYFVSVILVYIRIPLWDIHLGLENLICHDSHQNSDEDGDIKEDNRIWRHVMKLPQQIGEAVPQLIIAAVFYSRNSHWLSTLEMIQGGLKMMLSVGSIILGILNGCWVLYNA